MMCPPPPPLLPARCGAEQEVGAVILQHTSPPLAHQPLGVSEHFCGKDTRAPGACKWHINTHYRCCRSSSCVKLEHVFVLGLFFIYYFFSPAASPFRLRRNRQENCTSPIFGSSVRVFKAKKSGQFACRSLTWPPNDFAGGRRRKREPAWGNVMQR